MASSLDLLARLRVVLLLQVDLRERDVDLRQAGIGLRGALEGEALRPKSP